VEYELAGLADVVSIFSSSDMSAISPSLELVDRLQQLAERAAETVEAHNAERVTAAREVPQRSPAGPLEPTAADDVLEMRIAPAASRRWR
jgi:hypothetical protein